MNIIEAEDMVKGLPDQVLFQEAQFPSGRIPQFLAVSEVQRRQDMRQRFQANQQGQQPTVKDQILQGGIAAAGGPPPGAEQPPPMAPQMPQDGPPPVAAFRGGMMPYGMADGGMTPGGIVYMQEGRKVPGIFSMQHQFPGLYDDSGELKPGYAAVRDFLAPRRSGTSVVREAQALASQGKTNEAIQLLRSEGIDPRQAFGSQALAAATPAREVPAQTAPPQAAPGPVDFMAAQKRTPMDFALPASFGLPSNMDLNAPAADQPVSPGGIADIAQQPPQQPSGEIPSYLAEFLKTQERSPEVQAAIDLNRKMAEQGLPPPVDLSQYVQSAQQRQQEAKDEARRMAIANALMGLGTGLASGDTAAGLQRATQMATETLREGRKEAQAEGRMVEQLQLQQAQQQRQAALDAMKFKSESVNAIANLVSGEEKANRNDKLQAAQIVATYSAALERNRSELAAQGRLDERSERTARTAALQSAREAYLSNPTNTTGKTNQEIAREINEMARMLDPDSFGSNQAAPRSDRFKITEVQTRR